MSSEDKSPKNIWEVIQNVAFKIIERPEGIIYVIAILGMGVIGIVLWRGTIDPKYFPLAIGAIIILFLLPFFTFCFFHRPKLVESKLEGRYFVGIDIGRNKIEYCLIDNNEFEKGNYERVRVHSGIKKTSKQIRKIYPILGEIIVELSKEAQKKNIRSISGIGIGLPGQVDPKGGMLINAPGFGGVKNIPFITTLRDYIGNNLRDYLPYQYYESLKSDFPIEIDNDVRCATRYAWKRERFDDVICIFVGNGLGSGIVLGGKMLYGHNFTAGEIGHTTISEAKRDCKCGLEGAHWETYCSSYGMINIAKNLNPTKYERLKQEYSTIKQQEKYTILLQDDWFKNYSENHFDKEQRELTTYFFSLAFYAREEYACEVVSAFIKYLAIGIANYINIINPQNSAFGRRNGRSILY